MWRQETHEVAHQDDLVDIDESRLLRQPPAPCRAARRGNDRRRRGGAVGQLALACSPAAETAARKQRSLVAPEDGLPCEKKSSDSTIRCLASACIKILLGNVCGGMGVPAGGHRARLDRLYYKNANLSILTSNRTLSACRRHHAAARCADVPPRGAGAGSPPARGPRGAAAAAPRGGAPGACGGAGIAARLALGATSRMAHPRRAPAPSRRRAPGAGLAGGCRLFVAFARHDSGPAGAGCPCPTAGWRGAHCRPAGGGPPAAPSGGGAAARDLGAVFDSERAPASLPSTCTRYGRHRRRRVSLPSPGSGCS